MNKNHAKILVASLVFISSFYLANFSFGQGFGGSSGGAQSFGGRIIKTKATQIESLENSNYSCMVIGTTIEVQPIKGPTSYMIPAGTVSRTGTTPNSGQLILGLHQGKSTITCILRVYPYTVVTVTLDTITYFGTSKN